MYKKSQIISADLIYGIIAFIMVVAVVVGAFLYGAFDNNLSTYDYEMDYLFSNFEKNLNQLNQSVVFIDRSRINKDKLFNFSSEYVDKSIDDLVIGNVGNFNGIGLYSEAYDVCLYFTDNNMSVIDLNGVKFIGKVKDLNCEFLISEGKNPCENFKSSLALFKPVLFDENDVSKNRIIQMNLVVCKI